MVFIPRAQPHAQSLFLFPIVFGINLIHNQSTSPVEHASQGGASLQFHVSFQEKCFITP